ncbi:hypothetical protein GIB67_028941 [Kingdonia uniflora]|uniref:Uncharacterized protein n=1 Tax=Kingdonia uniflora TaxID=39325 RepID=A0A7J7LBZ7_9MAGN|nr:hypothetical protein GIB67_028941 [Kingdonia uniflora]
MILSSIEEMDDRNEKESCIDCQQQQQSCSCAENRKVLHGTQNQPKSNPFGFGQRNSPLAKQLIKSKSFGFGRNDSHCLQQQQFTKSLSFGCDRSDSHFLHHEQPKSHSFGIDKDSMPGAPTGTPSKARAHEDMQVNVDVGLDNLSTLDFLNEAEIVGSHFKKCCREEDRIREISGENLLSPTKMILWRSVFCPRCVVDGKPIYSDEIGLEQPKTAASLLTSIRLPADVQHMDNISHSDSYHFGMHGLYQAINSFAHNFDMFVTVQEQMKAVAAESEKKDRELESLRAMVADLESKLKEEQQEKKEIKEKLQSQASTVVVDQLKKLYEEYMAS